jgi:hypothetical protein
MSMTTIDRILARKAGLDTCPQAKPIASAFFHCVELGYAEALADCAPWKTASTLLPSGSRTNAPK